MADGYALIAGAGPGLGAALAHRFAAGGLNVAVAARRHEGVAGIAEAIAQNGGTAQAYSCDVTREAEVRDCFERADRDLGPLRAAIFNAGTFKPGSLLGIETSDFEACWQTGCLGGFLVGREAARRLLERESGSILFTGATAAWRGGNGFANLAVPKFGLRALAQSMARELGPHGIHVAHVVIDGRIEPPEHAPAGDDEPPDSQLPPAAIAETYWQLHCQPRGAWTHELDLRPWCEPF